MCTQTSCLSLYKKTFNSHTSCFSSAIKNASVLWDLANWKLISQTSPIQTGLFQAPQASPRISDLSLPVCLTSRQKSHCLGIIATIDNLCQFLCTFLLFALPNYNKMVVFTLNSLYFKDPLTKIATFMYFLHRKPSQVMTVVLDPLSSNGTISRLDSLHYR